MKLHNTKRRDFIVASVAFGLALGFGPRTLAQVFRWVKFDRDAYAGPLIDVLNALTLKCDAGKLTPEQYTEELSRRLLDIKPRIEFEAWSEEIKVKQGMAKLYQSSRSKRMPALSLFYIPVNMSHAPHSHHSMVSVQTILEGKLHVREYDRVKLFEPGLLGIKKRSDKVLSAGEQIVMTDQSRNVHWFGAVEKPVVLLNCNSDVRSGETFYPRTGRKNFRIYVDPTTGMVRENLLVAKEIEGRQLIQQHLEKFDRQPLGAFEA